MLLAYEVEGHDTYWEVYTSEGQNYVRTIETEDMGDWLAEMRNDPVVQGDVKLFPQEPYQVMYALHIELDKFFGNETYPLDDCPAIHDPMAPLDEFYCEGCKAFAGWAKKKTAGDYFGNPLLWNPMTSGEMLTNV